jgi:CBS domain-containing protein
VADRIADIMTKQVHSVAEQTSLRQVAKLMRDKKIGDVLVTDKTGKLRGIVTDRDVVVRAVADSKDPDSTMVGDICTDQITTLREDATVDEAVNLMRQNAIRRIPVVRDDKPVGIVSIGDLAKQKDPNSALADISMAPPNN